MPCETDPMDAVQESLSVRYVRFYSRMHSIALEMAT